MIKTIVFDFGNVIGFFDHERTLLRLAEHTDMTTEAMRAAIVASDLQDAYESGRLSTAQFLERTRQLCRLCCCDEVLTAAWEDIFWPNEEVCALVARLKGRYRLLLGSNTNELHARRFRRQFAEVLAHFDALVLSHEVGARKPLAAFFRHCESLAGCAPHECLFIDDLPANVEGATACGWHGIVYDRADDLEARLAEKGIVVGPDGI
jgi:FMN phosphatase YigB (HAD superfamily)